MTHGFDDQGRKFDKYGNLKEWWTEEDAKKFNSRTEILVNQYDACIVSGLLHANGRLTLGENIADLGGLQIAFEALSMTQGEACYHSAIDGFTQQQRFFLAYAHVWAQNIRDEEIQRRLKEDEHSLGSLRVNVPLRNTEAFHEAFASKPGDPMYLAESERAVIW
jgi:putative endopeptidase